MKLADVNTEERILEAAKTVFMKYGLYGARMQDIADTAGINKALLHYYFRNKEKLFDHVFDGALSKYFQQMEVFSDKSLPLIDRINRYIDQMIDFLTEYPQMSIFIIKEISTNPELFHDKVHKIKNHKSTSLIAVLKESIELKEIPDIDPVIFLMNLHSLCAYPFVASPIFKVIIEKSKTTWSDPNNEKHKQSVKEFVAFKLSN